MKIILKLLLVFVLLSVGACKIDKINRNCSSCEDCRIKGMATNLNRPGKVSYQKTKHYCGNRLMSIVKAKYKFGFIEYLDQIQRYTIYQKVIRFDEQGKRDTVYYAVDNRGNN